MLSTPLKLVALLALTAAGLAAQAQPPSFFLLAQAAPPAGGASAPSAEGPPEGASESRKASPRSGPPRRGVGVVISMALA